MQEPEAALVLCKLHVTQHTAAVLIGMRKIAVVDAAVDPSVVAAGNFGHHTAGRLAGMDAAMIHTAAQIQPARIGALTEQAAHLRGCIAGKVHVHINDNVLVHAPRRIGKRAERLGDGFRFVIRIRLDDRSQGVCLIPLHN